MYPNKCKKCLKFISYIFPSFDEMEQEWNLCVCGQDEETLKFFKEKNYHGLNGEKSKFTGLLQQEMKIKIGDIVRIKDEGHCRINFCVNEIVNDLADCSWHVLHHCREKRFRMNNEWDILSQWIPLENLIVVDPKIERELSQRLYEIQNKTLTEKNIQYLRQKLVKFKKHKWYKFWENI